MVFAAARDESAVQSPSAVLALDWIDVQATLGGDGGAYARLVHRYQQPISGYMWRFTRQRAEWEELVHDVFVEAYFSLGSYRGQAPLLHWLKRLATRVGYRLWKRKRREPAQLPVDSAAAAAQRDDPTGSAQEAAELVHLLLRRLAPRDRLAITLSYLESCSVAEIADLTGWSRSMVKVQLHRAHRRLRKLCEAMDIEL
jgi:RNA polymerase sigma-70 factor (ECF subfamily)